MKALIGAGLLLASSAANATDLDDLARQGYAVVIETRVDGEFEGCDFGRIIRFQNGLTFECQTYRYTYAWSPEVLILRNVQSGDIRVLIRDDEYRGIVYQAR